MKCFAILFMIFLPFCISCSGRIEKAALTKEGLYCAEYSWDDLFLDNAIPDMFCARMILIDEPCFEKEYLDNLSLAFRFIIAPLREYSTVYRIIELDGCAIITRKTVPPPYFNMLAFYRNEGSKIVEYEYLSKKMTAKEYESVLGIISEIKIGDRRLEQEEITSTFAEIEYYKDKDMTKGILSDELVIEKMQTLFTNLCKTQ
jgi:hypothetical protein